MKKTILILAALALLFSCATRPAGSKRETNHGGSFYPASLRPSFLYSEGVKAELMGDPSTATMLFDRVLAADSTHAPSYFELASIYIHSDPTRALAYSRKALAFDSTNIWYRGLLGRLMIVTGRYDEAFDIYTDLVRLSPRNPDNYRMLAALYGERNQPFTAIALLDSAEYKLGKIEELSDMKRELLIDVSLYDKAIAESRAMIAEYPWNDRNYRILGALYQQTGKDSLAQASFSEALRLNPDNIENLSALADYYRLRGNMLDFFAMTKQIMASDQMPVQDKIRIIGELKGNRVFYQEYFFQIRDLVSTLLVKYPNDYRVIDLYGESLIASNGVEQALAFYKTHLKDPTVPVDVYNTVLDMEAYLKHPDSVVYYTEQALKRFPHNTELYLRLGGSMDYLERRGEALEAYRKAFKHARGDSMQSVVLGIIGDHYHTQNKQKECFRYYDQALKKWPDNAVVLNNYSYYLSTDGPGGRDLPRSIAMAEKATALSQGNPTYLDTYAWALFKAGRLPEAKKVMQQAISLDTTESQELFVHYGDILCALKEYFMASVYWRKALEKGYDPEQINARLKQIEGK